MAYQSLASSHPYGNWFPLFNCSTIKAVYSKLEIIVKVKMGLDKVPFPLSALDHPPGSIPDIEINNFIMSCFKAAIGNVCDTRAIKLIEYLQDNPPKISFENPKIPTGEITQIERNLIEHIFWFGIDLPGSKHNPYGKPGYFSNFFIDMFFGNYTEFMGHIKTLTKKELATALVTREGYCQYSPIFAPILGLKMVFLGLNPIFTNEEKKEIRSMYCGQNENKHIDIMKKLIELGAEVNANDIYGYTPLHYPMISVCQTLTPFTESVFEIAIKLLLENGANPNAESRDGQRPLDFVRQATMPPELRVVDTLLQYNARLIEKFRVNDLRASVEDNGSKNLALRVREAMPRDQGECEKCQKASEKKCAACGEVFYCTPACQKVDWKFHKVACKKIKSAEKK